MIIKNLFYGFFVTLLLTFPKITNAGPPLYFWYRNTPYGKLSCLQRAESKLNEINATDIRQDGESMTASFRDATIIIHCRGNEAVIIVAGSNAGTISAEIKEAF